MRRLHAFLHRMLGLFSRKSREAEMSEEMRAHLEGLAERHIAAGLPPSEALLAAKRQFGNIGSLQERCREQRESLWLDQLLRDLRFALRSLAKNQGATLLSVLSLALGIGVTTALFSLADAYLFHPFPFARPEELFVVQSHGEGGRPLRYTWQDYEKMAPACAPFGELAASLKRGFIISREEGEEVVTGRAVTANVFSLIGAQASLGRASVAMHEGVPRVVLSNRLWRSRFGGDPGAIGSTVRINRHDCIIAGVLPDAFCKLDRLVAIDLWIGLEAVFEVMPDGRNPQRRSGDLHFLTRLKPGASRLAAADALDASIRGPEGYKLAPAGSPATQLLPDYSMDWQKMLIAGALFLMLLALLLFVACANVAQLQLAQAELRKRELALRLALGSSAWSVARLLLLEVGMLSVAGAGLGLFLAHALLSGLNATLGGYSNWLSLGARLDWRALLFSTGATVAVLALTGLAPARMALRLDLMQVLKAGQGTPRTRLLWQRLLVSGQAAVSVALFGLAVLFLQNLEHAKAVRPGFDPGKSILVIGVAPGRSQPGTSWATQACDRVASLPGVRGATFARSLPLTGSGVGHRATVQLSDQAPFPVGFNLVGPDYMTRMGTRILAGRGLDAGDRSGSVPVLVVTQSFASQAFGSANPVGEWITVDGIKRQIVGLAEDAPPAMNLHTPPQPYLYLPFSSMTGEFCLFVETSVEPESLLSAVRGELKRFDQGSVFLHANSLRRHLELALFADRTIATGTTWIGLLGFLLTGAGLFGVIQFMVNQRTREIGVRMSLGADRAQIRRMVLNESLRTVSWGLLAGLMLLTLAMHLVQSYVIGLSPIDPWAYGASLLAVLTVAVAAAWLPARRAANIDPVEALRAD